MDYKQKYIDALERAKKYNIDDAYASQGTVIKSIFPELRESEDERIRKTLIEELSACNTVGELKFRLPAPTREECIAWLEKQKEQKPAGWNEEDEKMSISILNLLCSQVAYVTSNGTITGKLFPTYVNERDWFKKRLKSLRPSWKPSEEQMNGLAHAINLDVYDAKRYKLDSLYNDLKKLM